MAMPHLQLAQDVRLVFAGNNPLEWNSTLAFRRLLLPIFSKTGLATMGPVIAASTINNLFGNFRTQRKPKRKKKKAGSGTLTANILYYFESPFFHIFIGIPPNRTHILVYPVTATLFFTFYVIKESITLLRGWSAYVRDQEYLVGRQLHNMHEDAAAPVVQEQELQLNQSADGNNDPHPTHYGIQRSSSELGLESMASSSATAAGSAQPALEDRIETYRTERLSSPAKDDHPTQYGIHTADSDSESESSSSHARRTLVVENGDEWENGSIASRIRSRRRNQRLQEHV